MPGLLIMNQLGANGAGPAKGLQGNGANSASPPVEGKPLVNGDRPASLVDPQLDVLRSALTNGDVPSVAGQVDVPPSLLQMPPEILHITETYQSFGKLIERVAQECYNDLDTVLGKMIDAHTKLAQANGPATNGIGGTFVNGAGHDHGAPRRTALMEWADKHRARFIKLLVLSRWARDAEDVSKLIDLNYWIYQQTQAIDLAAEWVGRVKLEMSEAKIPNPDIASALEALLTGKASWMPELGYMPVEPLSPQKMLKIVRDLNTALSIRINLHEDLPRHLRSWRIASGRATFTIPSECEFDVSIADEDPSSQFYFIDLRFLFSPTTAIPDGNFRSALEGRVNAILAMSGLSGCYEFLHNFILTHKISILRTQAAQLRVGAWAGTIRVEPVHRNLVVQYWKDSPAGKNWIEIGVASGKPKEGRITFRGPEPSKISVRWVRSGKGVEDPEFSFDWNKLSMDRVLQEVVARHSSFILAEISDGLLAAASGETAISTRLLASEKDPLQCSLEASLGHSTIALALDPITGRYVLRPVSRAASKIESVINENKMAPAEVGSRLELLLCANLQTQVDKEAKFAGWKTLQNIDLRQESLKHAFKQEVIRITLFRCAGWTSNWAIAALFNGRGQSWWIAELAETASSSHMTRTFLLRRPSGSRPPAPVSRASLSEIERIAVMYISFLTAARVLKQDRVPHRLCSHTVIQPGETEADASSHRFPELHIQHSWLLHQQIKGADYAGNTVRISHYGFEEADGKVRHVVKGTLVSNKKTKLKDIMTDVHDEDVAFYDGGFAILLRSEFGTSFVDQLIHRLRDIDRVVTVVETLQSHRLEREKTSLSSVSFKYAGNLTASIKFNEGAPIRLDLPPDNPHHRIKTFLAKVINEKPDGVQRFIRALASTLPLLQAFESLERRDLSRHSIQIHPRNLDWFCVKYSNPPCTFDIRLRPKRSAFQWHINDRPGSAPARPEGFSSALKAVFREQGKAWQGLWSGIVAEIKGVNEALLKLDEVVAKFATEKGKPGAARQPASGAKQTRQHDVVVID